MRVRALLQCLTILAVLPSAQGQSIPLDQAKTQAQQDLQGALQRLGAARNAIATEEPRLAADFHKIEAELREKRRLARLARTAVTDRREVLRELENTQYRLGQDVSALSGMLRDHALKVDTRNAPGVPALPLKKEVIVPKPNTPPPTALEDRVAVIETSLERLGKLFGGVSAPGTAVATDGTVQEGTFVALGPESWFSSRDGQAGGAVEPGKEGSAPRILPGDATAAARLIAGQEAELEIDFTGGKARLVEESTRIGIWESIQAGGFWVWPILALGIISFAFGGFKILQFSRVRKPGLLWMDEIIRAVKEGQPAKAEELAQQARHPVGPVMQKAVQASGRGLEAIEETIYEALIGVKAWSGSLLPFIAVTAATAPLLGLLGTVSGMIQTFQMITVVGSGDPKPLAGGISEALTATAWGLVVAVPSLLLHAYLTRRSQDILQSSEQLGLAFVNSLRK